MVTLSNISKLYPDKNDKILNNISFSVREGEFVTVFGPNGCGKTTLLSIISGLDQADAGQILTDSSTLPKIAFVFQNVCDSMLPWGSIYDNINLGLDHADLCQPAKQKIINGLIQIIGLGQCQNKYFCELSGGQKQLVAIGRALAFQPTLLVMDEPFCALDYSTTKKLELILLKLWQKTKTSIVLVSHDIDEAIFLADKVIVLSSKPARIKNIIPVPLSRPRSFACLNTQNFRKIKKQILDIFDYEN